MRLSEKLLIPAALILFVVSLASGATISGSVRGPDGAPFMGAFVIAENNQNKMTISVLSDKQGQYRIPNLAAATYTVRIRAIGYKSDPRESVSLKENQKASSTSPFRPVPCAGVT